MNEVIYISSRLFNYSVEFVTNSENVIAGFKQNTTYVIDRNIYRLYECRFKAIPRNNIYFMEATEDKKNMETVMDIIGFWKKNQVKKNWTVVCFGGGITQDVTTMASNLYLRNVDWYFFPTTLLSMCDSCIGGKCGINFGEYKNQLGVFYPPKKIFIDTSFIDTLSKGDVLNGWGELLKFSLTLYPDFYNKLKGETDYYHCANIDYYIHRGLSVKKEIIEQDEFESDLRRVLNYGHTFGHALEAYTHHAIPHGKGVIWGIDVVNYFAWREGLIDEAYYLDIKKLIRDAFLTEEIVVDNPDVLFGIIKSDKKVKDNTMWFAMLNAPSHLIVYPMQIDEKLNSYFKEYLRSTNEYYSN